MIPTELAQLRAHMEWADARVWAEVLRVPAARDDPRIRELLHHVHTVQLAYAQLLRDRPLEIPELESFADAAAIRDWGREGHGRVRDFLAHVSPDELAREVDFPWAERLTERFGRVHPTTVRQALLQLPSHSTYHRGQVNARLREVGGEPPLVDFVAWVWAGRPGPEW